MNKTMFTKEIANSLLIILGSISLTLAVVCFFVPNELLTGGSAGLSLLLHYITPFSIGTLMVAVNLPLLLVGHKFLGKMFVVRTVFTIALISALIDFSYEILSLTAFVNDPVLASIFGGILIGLGLALVMKGGSSAGGSTIVARVVSSRTEIKASSVILWIDSIIIVSALLIFDTREEILWSVVSIYVTMKVVDFILIGSLSKKVVYLVTNKTDLFKELIKDELGPHGTILSGTGLNQDEEKRMILIVVEVAKLHVLRRMIEQHDKEAFLIISEANELMGRGN